MLRRRYGSGLRLMKCVRLRVKEGIDLLSVERILGPGRLGRVFAVLGGGFEDPSPGRVVEGNLPFAEIVLGIAQYILQHRQHIAQGGRRMGEVFRDGDMEAQHGIICAVAAHAHALEIRLQVRRGQQKRDFQAGTRGNGALLALAGQRHGNAGDRLVDG